MGAYASFYVAVDAIADSLCSFLFLNALQNEQSISSDDTRRRLTARWRTIEKFDRTDVDRHEHFYLSDWTLTMSSS